MKHFEVALIKYRIFLLLKCYLFCPFIFNFVQNFLVQPLSILCLMIFFFLFSCNLKGKFNDLELARGRHIKSCEKILSISVMNTRHGGKSSNIYMFHCSITSRSGYNLNNKHFTLPCSGTRHILSQRTSNPTHSITSQALCWSLRTPCKEPDVRKCWPCTYSFKSRDL